MTFEKRSSTLRLALGATALTLAGSIASADQQILDDLIVQGSICAGFDCVNGESFGFDTLRLKENNLRIHFDDTSTSASFPRNDWRITANDSSNGGLSRFSIDDVTAGRTTFTIEAGADSNALYIDTGGRVGFSTSTPAVELHVVDGDTPTLRLEQDGSAGFTAQTWDVAGNEANYFIRDVTNGSRLSFKIRPGALSDSLTIQGDGDIGIGTNSPTATAQLDVVGNELIAAIFRGNGTKLVDVKSDNNEATQYRMITNSGNRRFVALNAAGSVETQMVFDNNRIQLAGATNTTNLWATINSNGIALPSGAAFSVNAVNLNVPDYVFAEDYKLMPLDQLGAFVAANKHLPNVPSAAEIQSTSLNMTEMQMALLEKVEELTLYTLEQQKSIDALTRRLNSLTD